MDHHSLDLHRVLRQLVLVSPVFKLFQRFDVFRILDRNEVSPPLKRRQILLALLHRIIRKKRILPQFLVYIFLIQPVFHSLVF